MPVAITPTIRKYARKTGQAIPTVKNEPKPNAGEEKWLAAWTRLYPDIELRRQVPFKIPNHRNPFKMDYLHEATKVVIEISGGVHSIQSVRRRDYMRTRYLSDNGFLVYTFDPADLTKKDIDSHCEQVYRAIMNRLK